MCHAASPTVAGLGLVSCHSSLQCLLPAHPAARCIAITTHQVTMDMMHQTLHLIAGKVGSRRHRARMRPGGRRQWVGDEGVGGEERGHCMFGKGEEGAGGGGGRV